MPTRIACMNNLRQIGIAYRIWSNDHGDRFPASTPETNGGWRDLLHGTGASTYAWTNYVTMANELGLNPLVLVCPADERKPADTFRNLVSNTNISYFIGPGANDTYPQAILGGDRNLGPGTTPSQDYGYSPADGKGNDVIINGPVLLVAQDALEGEVGRRRKYPPGRRQRPASDLRKPKLELAEPRVAKPQSASRPDQRRRSPPDFPLALRPAFSARAFFNSKGKTFSRGERGARRERQVNLTPSRISRT